MNPPAGPSGVPEARAFEVGDLVQIQRETEILLPYVGRGCWALDNELQPLWEGTPFGDHDQDTNDQSLPLICKSGSELYVTRACIAIYDGPETDTLNYRAVSVSYTPGVLTNTDNYIVFKCDLRECVPGGPADTTCDSEEGLDTS